MILCPQCSGAARWSNALGRLYCLPCSIHFPHPPQYWWQTIAKCIQPWELYARKLAEKVPHLYERYDSWTRIAPVSR